jgi:hypothetical protein
MDRRLIPANGRVAAAHLKGVVEAERYVEAEARRVVRAVTDLCLSPSGARERQLLRGETFMVLELTDAWAFGFADKDGYVGWVETAALVGHPKARPTHRVSALRSYGKSTPGLKEMGRITPLPHGAQLAVMSEHDGWSKISWGRGTVPADLFVPTSHLAPLTRFHADPVAVAELFLGTPYLWGGNSDQGLDCSGLVQAGCLACGIACPGDSDLQQVELGTELPPGAPLQRGDLLFWKGHVAWVSDPDMLIHANAFHMAVAFEPVAEAIARIEAHGDGPVTAHKRLEIFA